MPLTADHLDRLKEMLAEGVLEATLADGSRVKFDSTEQLKARIRWVADELDLNTDKNNTVYPSHSRGYQ